MRVNKDGYLLRLDCPACGKHCEAMKPERANAEYRYPHWYDGDRGTCACGANVVVSADGERAHLELVERVMTSRESRIRALAETWLMQQWPNKREMTCMAHRALEKATECVDTIDALPVPPGQKVDCKDCEGTGAQTLDYTRYTCDNCNGTGKAER